MLKKITKKQIIIISILSCADLFIMLIFYYLSIKGAIKFDYYYLSSMLGAILFLLGWTIPNHFEYDYRRKEKVLTGPLPEEIKQKKFNYRFPLFMAGLICLIISMIFSYL